MRRFFVYIAMCLMALSMVSCADNEKKENTAEKSSAKVENSKTSVRKPVSKSKKKKFLLPNASGLPYEMLVVIGDDQWERPLGRAVFGVLDTDVPGLPQSERSFRITRIAPSAFDTHSQSRTVNMKLIPLRSPRFIAE